MMVGILLAVNAAVTFGLLRWLRRRPALSSRNRELHAYEVACLTGGRKHAVIAALAANHESGAVQIPVGRLIPGRGHPASLTELDKVVVQVARTRRRSTPRRLHRNDSIAAAVDRLADDLVYAGLALAATSAPHCPDRSGAADSPVRRRLRAAPGRVENAPDDTGRACRVPAGFLVAGDKAGNWTAWYRQAIPLAEERYAAYLKEGTQP